MEAKHYRISPTLNKTLIVVINDTVKDVVIEGLERGGTLFIPAASFRKLISVENKIDHVDNVNPIIFMHGYNDKVIRISQIDKELV